MSVWQAALLGIVQGVAEFLPISSSGHLVLAQAWLGWTEPAVLFDVFLHSATLLAVIIFFWRDLWQLKPRDFLVILIGTIPAGVVGVMFKDQIEALFGHITYVSVELIITGLLNLWADRQLDNPPPQPRTEVTIQDSLIIGAAQAVAISPGISRSGATVFAGVMRGLDRTTAFRFSFLLSLPAVGGAILLQLKDAVETNFAGFEPVPFAAGWIFSFIFGLASLYIFKYIMQRAKLQWFGWYCVVVGILALVVSSAF